MAACGDDGEAARAAGAAGGFVRFAPVEAAARERWERRRRGSFASLLEAAAAAGFVRFAPVEAAAGRWEWRGGNGGSGGGVRSGGGGNGGSGGRDMYLGGNRSGYNNVCP